MTRRVLPVLRTMLTVLALGPWSGCWPGEPGYDPDANGKCNNNGRCEVLAGEDEVFCVKDCPRCLAIQVFVNGADKSDGQSLLAASDGKTLSLGEQTVQIQFGSEIHQSTSSIVDFTLVGVVTSTSTVTFTSSGCLAGSVAPPTEGAFRVEVGDGTTFQTVGYWASKREGGGGGGSQPNVATFSLCGMVTTAKYIRLVGLKGAKATLDYVKADSCS